MIPCRPKPGEDEDDLLDFQARFLASGEKPSVKVISCQKKNTTSSTKVLEKDIVKFGSTEQTSHLHGEKSITEDKNLLNKNASKKKCNVRDDVEEEMDRYDTHITKVLSSIIKEREPRVPPTFPCTVTVANPQATRRIVKKNSSKVRSIFAQQFQSSAMKTSRGNPADDVKEAGLEGAFSAPRLVAGSGLGGDASSEVRAIHEENIDKLSRMTTEEIRNERERLEESLDPQVLAFIKRKRGNEAPTDDEPVKKSQDTRGREEVSSPLMTKEEWLHMDDHESDKMRWMEAVPERSVDEQIKLPNRFDFEGNLLSLEESSAMPPHIGLHHHGDEPDLAGYTLQELLSLSRSDFLQQRVFALKLLARVISKDKAGAYADPLPTAVFPLLVDAGAVFIFRWALDERSGSGMQAAVDAIFALLSPPQQQLACLEEKLLSHRGCESPSLQPLSSLVAKETKEETDFELTSRDLVLGLVRMDVLPRIRYILEVCRPDHAVEHKCLAILARVALHSQQAAIRVLECPRLLDWLVGQHLSPPPPTLPAKSPPAEVMKLLRVILQSGRYAAARLLGNHPPIKAFMFSILAKVGGASRQEALSASCELEVWRAWWVSLSYGIALDWFRDLVPTMMQQLQVCNHLVSESRDTAALVWTQHVIKAITCALSNVNNAREPPNFQGLGWEEVCGFYPPVKTLLKWTIEGLMTQQCPLEVGLVGVAACLLDAVASFHERGGHHLPDLLHEAEEVVKMTEPLHAKVLESKDALMSSSFLSSPLPSLPQPLPGSPSDPSSVTKQRFICAFLRCSVTMARANKSVCACYVSFFTTWLSSDGSGHVIDTSSRLPCQAVFWLVKLFLIAVTEQPALLPLAPHFHSLSLSCLSSLPPGEEWLGRELINHVIFHPDMMRDAAIQDELPTMRTTYAACLAFAGRHLSKSSHWAAQNPQEIETFFLPVDNGPLLPRDWAFLPIINLYDVTIHQGEASSSSSVLRSVRSSLLFLLTMERLRPHFSSRVSSTSKITRLMCLYMAGSDLFFDATVASLLKELYRKCCATGSDVNFDQPTDGMISFYDFYMSLLDQFESVSYGDPLFSAVLLLPLTQRDRSEHKMALWAQHCDAIRSIGINGDQVLLPSHLYFHPLETDYDVIRAYLRTLVTGKCSRRHSPFLHQVALHHIAGYYKVCNDRRHKQEILSACSSLDDLRDAVAGQTIT